MVNSVAELYVEAFSIRGNVSKFEAINPQTGERVEMDVWAMRAAPDQYWDLLFMIEEISLTTGDDRMVKSTSFVTRYPDLEKDMADVTYHPSVPSWKIDPVKVKEYFNARN